jgi:hypothetical protein
MHGRTSSTRLIAALAITTVVALTLPTLVRAAPVPMRASAVNAGSVLALIPIARARVAAAETAATAADSAALAERQRVAAAAYTAARATTKASVAKSPRVSDQTQAKAILASLKTRYHRYLSGATVTMGSARGYQAISYYTSGRIVVSPTHRASLTRIMNHEIWHIIDWRDNGRIDWGERVPPSNAASYR